MENMPTKTYDAEAGGYKVTNQPTYDVPVEVETSGGGAPVMSLKLLSFGEALFNIRAGERVSRRGWNGTNMWIALQTPDENSKMSKPYIFMKTAQEDLIPWVVSQSDMLTDDWYVVKP